MEILGILGARTAYRTSRKPLPLLQEEHSKVMKSNGVFLSNCYRSSITPRSFGYTHTHIVMSLIKSNYTFRNAWRQILAHKLSALPSQEWMIHLMNLTLGAELQMIEIAIVAGNCELQSPGNLDSFCMTAWFGKERKYIHFPLGSRE